MKKCPKCNRAYDDSWGICINDNERLTQLEPDKKPKSIPQDLASISRTFLYIDVICLTFLILFVLFIVKRFDFIYEGFGAELPVFTRIVLSSHYIFIILALILIIKEKLKKKVVTLFINVAVSIILIFGGIPLLLWGMYLPLWQLSKVLDISGTGIMQAAIIAEKVCEEEGWEWANIHTEETDACWEFTTNHSRRGVKALIRIDKKTGKVLEKRRK